MSSGIGQCLNVRVDVAALRGHTKGCIYIVQKAAQRRALAKKKEKRNLNTFKETKMKCSE